MPQRPPSFRLRCCCHHYVVITPMHRSASPSPEPYAMMSENSHFLFRYRLNWILTMAPKSRSYNSLACGTDCDIISARSRLHLDFGLGPLASLSLLSRPEACCRAFQPEPDCATAIITSSWSSSRDGSSSARATEDNCAFTILLSCSKVQESTTAEEEQNLNRRQKKNMREANNKEQITDQYKAEAQEEKSQQQTRDQRSKKQKKMMMRMREEERCKTEGKWNLNSVIVLVLCCIDRILVHGLHPNVLFLCIFWFECADLLFDPILSEFGPLVILLLNQWQIWWISTLKR